MPDDQRRSTEQLLEPLNFHLMRVIQFILLTIIPQYLFAQGSVIARIVDAMDGHPLPYATVLLLDTRIGTITNIEGWFRLPLHGPTDSLQISYIGYRTMRIPFIAVLDGSDIRMRRAIAQLPEAVIRPDGADWYQRIVEASSWLRRTPEVTTKLFFGLDSRIDTFPVETIHSYYNGTFKSGTLTSLVYKQGNIGIAQKGERHYVNFSTAYALGLMDIHAMNSQFMRTPFAYSTVKQLKADYRVEPIEIGEGPDAVDRLRAVPRDSTADLFLMEVTLVHSRSQVLSFELNCVNCSRHPFVSLFPQGWIDGIDLRYRQTWSSVAPFVPEVLELDLLTTYCDNSFEDQFETKALMYTFDKGNPFIPTLFRWEPVFEDYRKIAWLPMDSAFMHRMRPPLPTARQLRDHAFIAEHNISNDPWYTQATKQYDLLKPVHVAWSSAKRITRHNLLGKARRRSGAPPPMYDVDLAFQLYLDLDTTNGDLLHRSVAVFDATRSYHEPKPQVWINSFLNIAFDLVEIERRRMEVKLNEPGMTVGRARTIHEEHSRRMRDAIKRYLLSTKKGFDISLLVDWNELVKKELGLDNLKVGEWDQGR